MNWNIILSICLFVCLLNLIYNFFIGLFLVRFQQNLFSRLNEMNLLVDKENIEKDIEEKTWDQKYEEELKTIAERISKNPEL